MLLNENMVDNCLGISAITGVVIMPEEVKYPEVIPALPLNVVQDVLFLDEGFSNRLPYGEFIRLATPEVIWEQRQKLEDQLDDMQLVPYAIYVVVRDDPLEEDGIVLYQRSKTVGESKLLGNYSIGFGGHPEDQDKVSGEEDRLLLQPTIMCARNRERDEEMLIQWGASAIHPDIKDMHFGYLNDTSNPVGRKHLGLVSVTLLSDDVSVESKEPNQIMKGIYPLSLLLDEELAYESWTKLCLDALKVLFNDNGKFVGKIHHDENSDAFVVTV